MGYKANDARPGVVTLKLEENHLVDEYYMTGCHIHKEIDNPAGIYAFVTWVVVVRIDGEFKQAESRGAFLVAQDLAPYMLSHVTDGNTFEDEFKAQIWTALQNKLDENGDPLVPVGGSYI